MKTSTNWVTTLLAHGLAVVLPLLAYTTGNSIVGNFATAYLWLWGIVQFILFVLASIGYCAIKYRTSDKGLGIDNLRERVTEQKLLSNIGSILTFVTPFVLVFTGYIAGGVYFLFLAMLLQFIVVNSRKELFKNL